MSSMPNRRTKAANSAKLATVTSTLAAIVAQKPSLGSSAGKSTNIGKVGTTYQNVYQA